jgi:hypothetical protein
MRGVDCRLVSHEHPDTKPRGDKSRPPGGLGAVDDRRSCVNVLNGAAHQAT